jgi:CMP-N-acetylneuraminic acid synthetase
MRILGLIPARGGSKGIPRKNIKLLGNKELIVYTIEVAKASQFITDVLVSTDDAEIADVALRHGAGVPFLRPAYLADDSSPTIDTVIHALEYLHENDKVYDAVCLLQATCPFRKQEDLDGAIQKFVKLTPDSLISVRAVPHVYNPYWVFEKQGRSEFLQLAKGDKIISRRQDLPAAYHRDGAVYITKTDVLIEQKSLYGEKIIAFEMQGSPDINIDTYADWEAAENYISLQKNRSDG